MNKNNKQYKSYKSQRTPKIHHKGIRHKRIRYNQDMYIPKRLKHFIMRKLYCENE